jgi:hypothetical protein
MLTLVFIMTGPPVRNHLTICIMSNISVYTKAFGFLGGQQVFEEKVGNLGLWDRKLSGLASKTWPIYNISTERLALGWVKRHIESFGGNSSQIMM